MRSEFALEMGALSETFEDDFRFGTAGFKRFEVSGAGWEACPQSHILG